MALTIVDRQGMASVALPHRQREHCGGVQTTGEKNDGFAHGKKFAEERLNLEVGASLPANSMIREQTRSHNQTG
jgi:hypothetical protein